MIVLIKHLARSEDPFAKAKMLIRDMLAKLQIEAGAAAMGKHISLRCWRRQLRRLKSSVKSVFEIEEATATSAELKEDVSELQRELATIAEKQAQMDALRRSARRDDVHVSEDLERW